MAHYIDKDALVAEIDKHLSYYKDLKDRGILSKEGETAYRVVRILKSDIISIEVKEVDLDKYINKYFKGWYVDLTDQGNILHSPDGQAGLMSVKKVAKHFFELGLKAQKGE